MDKVSSRGHYSSLDGALKAHRARKAEREARVEQRLSMVKNLNSQFFPTPHVSERPSLMDQNYQVDTMNQQPIYQSPIDMDSISTDLQQPEISQIQPMEMDEIYSEASMGSVADNALGIVQKEMANPEDVPADEMPKGSYVDYTV